MLQTTAIHQTKPNWWYPSKQCPGNKDAFVSLREDPRQLKKFSLNSMNYS